ncbi:MAG: hypothetical protein ACKOSQ_09685 [Planctomycetaceae bacterium]
MIEREIAGRTMHDLIGDIHGHADELEALLRALGYARRVKKVTATCCRSPKATRHRPEAGVSRQKVTVTFFRHLFRSKPADQV